MPLMPRAHGVARGLFFALLAALSAQAPASGEAPAFVLPAAAAAEAPPPIEGRDILDLSEEYLARRSALPTELPRLLSSLRACKVILVRGFFTDAYAFWRLGRVFGDQQDWLKASGVDFELASIESEADVKTNAAALARALRASSKPVLLVTHSKGSLDALEALTSDPAAAAKVRGWISLQGPFLGTPVADRAAASATLEPMLARLLRFMDGSPASLRDLTTVGRRAYLVERRAAVGRLTSSFPIICLASWKAPESGRRWDTPLKPVRDWLSSLGLLNDGLVPIESAVLPGAAYVRLEGIDHAAPVMSLGSSFDRLRMTQTLLAMLLERSRAD